MTDLDELRVALKSGEYDGTHIMRAWLLVDKVKELEEELKDADGAAQILANQKVELTAKLDKAKEALKCIDEDLVNPVHYILVKEVLEELDK